MGWFTFPVHFPFSKMALFVYGDALFSLDPPKTPRISILCLKQTPGNPGLFSPLCVSVLHAVWHTVGPQDCVSNGWELKQREIQTHGRARVEMTLTESGKSQPCPGVLQETSRPPTWIGTDPLALPRGQQP